MHPTLSYHLAQARTADLRHRARRDILARAARRPPGAARPASARRAEVAGRLATSRPLGQDPSLCTRPARASHHDRRDR
jgi:hypothetical protein